jgi:HIT family protein
MSDCIFCKIVTGEIGSSKVYEDDKIVAFKDINPMAPIHILVIPKEHIENVMQVNKSNSGIIAHIFETIPKIAKENGLSEGFRVVSNCNEIAGQSVFHLHFHLLGGKKLSLEMA